MKVLQKFANGGNVATEKRGGNAAGGNVVYNSLDLSNDLKGNNGKNRVYSQGDYAGVSHNLVFLENEIIHERNSQLNNVLQDLALNSSPGHSLFSPSSGGMGETKIIALRTKTNPEGQVEIVSVITDAPLKDGAGGYQKGGYYSEITNPSVTGEPLNVFQFRLDKKNEGFSSRVGKNQVNLDRSMGELTNDSPEAIGRQIFKSLSNNLTKANYDHWYSDEIKDDYSIQKLNYTNYFMPASNENREVATPRPFTTNLKISMSDGDKFEGSNLDIVMQTFMQRNFRQKNWNTFQQQPWQIMENPIPTDKHNDLVGGMNGFIYKGKNYEGFNPNYKMSIDKMVQNIVGQAGYNGLLQGMINEDGSWNKDVLSNIFQVNNVDGVNYLTINSGGYGSIRSGYGSKNTVYNLPLDTQIGMLFKQALDNHLIKHSPIMTEALKNANSGKGENFTAEGPDLAFNIDATSPVDGSLTKVKNLVAKFQTHAESTVEAENFNNRSLEERMSSVVRDGNKYALIADVVEDKNRKPVNVVDFNSNTNTNPNSRLYTPNNIIFTSSVVDRTRKQLENTITIDKKEPSVITPNNQFLPSLRTHENLVKQRGTDIVTDEDVVGVMGDWTHEEIAELNKEKGINGQQINPQKGSDYIIQKGDTLTKIARDNNTTIGDIMSKNPFIKDPNKIYAGDNIVLQTETKDGLPSYQSASKENPFGGIPAGTEQDNKQIYFDGQLQNWDSQNNRWTPATETKINKENLVDSTLSQNNDKNIMLENLNQSGNEVVEEIGSTTSNVANVTNVAGNIMKKYFENQKKEQELKELKEEENKEAVNNQDNNEEEEEERKVPMATQKSAGFYVDEQGEMIPQTQLHKYEVKEMKTGGIVNPIFAAEGSLLHQMTSNQGPMFAAGYSYTKKEKEEEEKKDDKKTDNSDNKKTDNKKEKKPKLTIRQRIDEMLKRKARKQRTKKELKESGEWKNLSFAEKRLTLKKAKKEGDYKKGAIYKNPNVK